MTDGHQRPLPVLSPELQIGFWARLNVARNQYLGPALAEAVRAADLSEVNRELAERVSAERLSEIAAFGLRGELVYPVPCLLAARPMLLGYYRLLYGISRKEFYGRSAFGTFAGMEDEGRLTDVPRARLDELCQSLIATAEQLFAAVQPVTVDVVHDLQLLTLGPQLRGARNNAIGKGATEVVFELIRGLVEDYVEASTSSVITIRNAAGRTVSITFTPDPDIAILEVLPTIAVPSVSIEIKGGSDISNVHNRLGEAEKSHQKAREAGFTQFWTIVRARIDMDLARRESPTTTFFFVLGEIIDPASHAHAEFRDRLHQTIGV